MPAPICLVVLASILAEDKDTLKIEPHTLCRCCRAWSQSSSPDHVHAHKNNRSHRPGHVFGDDLHLIYRPCKNVALPIFSTSPELQYGTHSIPLASRFKTISGSISP